MNSLSSRPKLLEISVETVEAALAAQRGGAHRIELCESLAVGGLTPSNELMRLAREQLHLPIFAMIRPRDGDFLYSDSEFAQMQRAIQIAKEAAMNGVVLGVLNAGRQVDVVRTQELVNFASPLPVTFHRAFDQTPDLHAALQAVLKTGATRLLTAGGKSTAPEGAGIIKELITIARNRLVVMPGRGIHGGNVASLFAETGAREFHAGLSGVVPRPGNDLPLFEREVRKLADQLKSLP